MNPRLVQVRNDLDQELELVMVILLEPAFPLDAGYLGKGIDGISYPYIKHQNGINIGWVQSGR